MAISANTYIPTLTSWVRADELKPGDYVYGADGLPKKIKTVQLYTPTEMYEVRLTGGLSVQGDKHLSFEAETIQFRKAFQKRNGKKKPRATLKRFSVTGMLSKGLVNTRLRKKEFSIPTTKPIQYRYEDLPVPPFIIGYWYGSSNRKSRLRATGDKQQIVRNKLLDLGYTCKVIAKKHLQTTPDILKTLLFHYGYIPNEIPDDYLFGSVEQRIELLNGLLLCRDTVYRRDTDTFQFTSKKPGLASRFQGLCESLGIRTRAHYYRGIRAHTIAFRTDLDLMVKRKPKPGISGFKRRYVEDIVRIDPAPCAHIETDGTFLAGEGYIAIC
jgi:hypothetical protein